MKKLEELGISPTPWTAHEWCQPDDIGSEVRDATGRPIIDTFDLSFYPQSHANCTFIAAAPELYDCLREALSTIAYTAPVDHAKWRAALAKASGEEVAN